MIFRAVRTNAARRMTGVLDLLEGAMFDLPDPLARDGKLGGEFLKRERRIDEPARLENSAFAVVEDLERKAQHLSAGLQLPTLGDTQFRIGVFVHQQVLHLD